ncbi:coiled-coil domain-containing protein 12-like [Haliotis rufescens]|uniref:coiled-coil domain-containing protein 12-like n=1 Tax=Haliotis rufescens TaxID=6454 RepID=UPI001EAF9013|nr:coiled-coil domain-containing protein 12-like [Haliotis rufescens]
MASVGTLENAARKRKERLRALREKKHENSKDEVSEQSESDKLPRPIFRSYKPQDEGLKEHALDVVKPGDVESEVKNQIEAGKTKHIVEEVDLLNLAPRKPDWDLKRDIAPKLEKLEKRTQRAIAELIRERLKASQEDLASVVNASEAVARADEDDEDD